VSLATGLAVFTVVVTAYFVAYNVSQFAMAGVAGPSVWRYQRRRNPRNLALVARLAAPPFVSIVVPAHNEALTIVDSIRALLALEYEAREIVVVNDGSKDDTLATLKQAFELVEAPVAFEQPLKSAPLRGVYRSLVEPALVVIDKINGGSKADAVNAGINAAAGGLVLVIDADTMLEPDALSRAAMPFLESPDTVAVGGYVAIANGCRIEHSRVTDVGMPRSWLARFQIVEYMRSFLLFRLACASGNGVAYEHAAKIGMAKLTQVTIGFQLGGQSYREVIFFESKKDMDRFKENKIELSAQVSAVAAAAGASANAKYVEGVMVFTMQKGGLMYEASVGGQKLKYEKG